MPRSHNDIVKRLWGAAKELRTNSKLKATGYSLLTLGLMFLSYTDFRFYQAEEEINRKGSEHGLTGTLHYEARGVISLPEKSGFSNLIKLPEDGDIGNNIDDAMKAIESENIEPKDFLPISVYANSRRDLSI